MSVVTPYSLSPDETSTFMAGTCYVQVVLFESDGSIDANLENWSSERISEVKEQITIACDWWETMWDNQGYVGDLQFTLDFTYADNPVATGYEPITRSSLFDYLWINEFLTGQGYAPLNTSNSSLDAAQQYADELRLANGTDWAFTIFVADSLVDGDGTFSDNAFGYAYVNGPYLHLTYDNQNWGIDNMAQIAAHEMGHIFGALDEYPSHDTYDSVSGYYGTQNLNASIGNPFPGNRVASLMAEAALQNWAFDNYTSSPSSLEMIGWRDSDGDGIIDVLDQPILAQNVNAVFDPLTRQLTCTGTFEPGVLPRAGGGNALTINTVDHLQFRFDGDGEWQNFNAQAWKAGELDLQAVLDIPIGVSQVEWRLIDADLTAVSPVYTLQVPDGDLQPPQLTGLPTVALAGRQAQFAWNPATDNIGVTLYQLELNGEIVEVAGEAWSRGDLALGDYRFRLRARDEAGNWSSWSDEQSFTITDSTVPVLSGLPQVQVQGNQVVVSWSAASDDQGVTGYTLRFGDDEIAAGTNLSWQLDNLAPGYYAYAVRAFDADGHDSGWSPTQYLALTAFHSQGLAVDLAGSAAVSLGVLTLAPGRYLLNGEFAAGLNATITVVDRQTGKTVGKTTVKNGVLLPFKTPLLLQGDYELFIVSSDRGASGGLAAVALAGEVFVQANQAEDDLHATAPTVSFSGADPALHEWVGYGDAVDYRQLDLEHSGSYDFTLGALENPAQLTVFRLDPLKGTLKALKKISVTPKFDRNGNWLDTGVISGLLLDQSETYYLQVIAAKASKGQNTPYTLTIGGTPFNHPDSTLADNDWQAANLPALAVAPDASIEDGWVGYGDATDFRLLTLEHSGSFDFTLGQLENPAQLTIYRLDPLKGTLKALKKVSVTPKFDRAGNWLDSGAITGLLLDRAETYYLEVVAPKAAKGLSSAYAVTIAGTQFNHPDSTLADNDWQAPGLPTLAAAGDMLTGGWAGYGDAIDFRRLTLDYSGVYDVTLGGLTDKAKLTIYEFNPERGMLKAVKNITVTPKFDRAGNWLDSGTLAGLLLDRSKTYFLSVEAPNAAKGSFTGYELQLGGTEFNQDVNPDDNAWNGTAVTWLDLNAGGDVAAGRWVGFGDPVDCFRFALDADQAGAWNFVLTPETAKAATMTVYRIVDGKLSKVSLRNGVASLAAGDYAVEIKSADGGKGKKNTAYDLAVFTPAPAPAPAPGTTQAGWLA